MRKRVNLIMRYVLGPMSLTTRVYATIVVVMLSAGIYFCYSWYAQERLTALVHDILDRRVVIMHTADHLKENMLSDQMSLFHFLTTGDRTDLAQCRSLAQATVDDIERLRMLTSSRVVQDRLDVLQTEVQQYFSEAQTLVDFTQVHDMTPPISRNDALRQSRHEPFSHHELDLLSGDSNSRLAQINALCDELITLNQNELEQARSEMNHTLTSARREALLAGLLVGFILLFVALQHLRALIEPLNALVDGVKRVEDGDLNFEIPVSGQDEIGRLTQSFNRMTRRIQEHRENLVRETLTDGLTGLFNQRHFRQLLKKETERSLRAGLPFSLLMVDVDHFKLYNDAQGHEMGNELLKRVAVIVKESLREMDIVARYGGDELSVILPNAPSAEAQALTVRLLDAVAQLRLIGEKAFPSGKATLSIGGATFPDDAASATDLILRADEALYAAKRAGRGCFRWCEGRKTEEWVEALR